MARPERTPRGPRSKPRVPGAATLPSAMPGVLWGLGYAALLAWAVLQGRLAPMVPAVLAALCVLTFGVYGADKKAARSGQWRTPEKTLHLLALAGGWPGAWAAQRLFRHKSSKPSFIAVYRATVGLHLAAMLAWVFWLQGQIIWR